MHQVVRIEMLFKKERDQLQQFENRSENRFFYEKETIMSKEKLTEEGIREAVKLVQSGLNDADVADYLGVAAETFSRWKNHPKSELQDQLCQALKEAEVKRKAALLARVQRASENNWQAAAWLLERRYPQEYAKPDRYHDQGIEEAVNAVKELTESIKAKADAADL